MNAFAVLALNPSSQGAWLILTLIAVTQMGPLKSVRRTTYRIVGTVLGAAISAVVPVFTNQHGQLLLAVACLILALFFRSGGNYWAYVTFLTPTIVLLCAKGDVLRTAEWRLLYTLVGASQVLLASAIVVIYQHRRVSGKATATPLIARPLARGVIPD